MEKLLTELLSPFAGRLVATFSAISLAFWVTGIAIAHSYPSKLLPPCLGHKDLCGILSGSWKTAALPTAVLAVVVIVISASVLASTSGMLTFLHGPDWWRRPGTALQRNARIDHSKRWTAGRRHRGSRYPHGLTSKSTDVPPLPTDVPLSSTRLANVFAAAQHRILVKHGLRMGSCRRLLIEVLAKEKRAELEALSGAVMRRVHTLNWFLITTVLAFLLPNPLISLCWAGASLLMAFLMYRAVCDAAGEYCDALEAVVVVHRADLYTAAGFPPPTSTADEPRRGRQLSAYLKGGELPTDTRLQWSRKGAVESAPGSPRPNPSRRGRSRL